MMTVQNTAPLRLTRRGRLVLTLFITTVLIALSVMFSLMFASQAGASDELVSPENAVSYSYLTVNHGDTLWQLAETLAPTNDPREVIAEIKQLNALSSSTVVPGQQLAIPLKYTP